MLKHIINTKFIVDELGKYHLNDITGNFFKNGINIDKLITFDGDGQHNHNDALNLLKICVDNNSDLVVGSRFINPKSIEAIKTNKLQ